MQKLVHGLTNLPFSGIIHSNLTQETEVFDDMNTAYGVVTEIYGLEGETRCPAEIIPLMPMPTKTARRRLSRPSWI